MTVARTARRRRKQATNKFRHMALIGRGNNNRSVYSVHSKEYYERHQAAVIATQRAMQQRTRKKG